MEINLKSQISNLKSQIPNWGIRVQLIAGITIITAAAIALLGLLSMRMLEWNSLYRKSKEAETIAAFIQTLVQDGKGFESHVLKGFVAKLSEKAVVKDMAIVDAKGNSIFVTGQGLPASSGQGRNIFIINGLNIKMVGGGWWTGAGKELLVSTTLRHGSGNIMFSMSLSDIREETANFKKFIFFYAIFDSIIIITFGAYLFSRGIIRPIRRLKETAENIAGGALEQRVGIKAGGEIGSLAVSFNVMADRLEEKIKTLERVNKELVAAQEELVRSEKLATVGRLAAGIAHEIGNPLGALLGYVDILKKSEVRGLPQQALSGGQESEEILKRFEKEILRIDAIVRGLLDFSRPSKGVLQDVNVNDVVRDSVNILLPQFANCGISFDMKLNEDIPHIPIDRGMLQQVFLNLFINAKDAMEKGGVITVKTGDVALQKNDKQIRMRRDDILGVAFIAMRSQDKVRRHINISVADTGKGIKQEDIGRIFDPFFTTKEQGKGTGLGLAVSLGIIQTFGGNIKVKSEVGKGTTFEVILPV